MQWPVSGTRNYSYDSSSGVCSMSRLGSCELGWRSIAKNPDPISLLPRRRGLRIGERRLPCKALRQRAPSCHALRTDCGIAVWPISPRSVVRRLRPRWADALLARTSPWQWFRWITPWSTLWSSMSGGRWDVLGHYRLRHRHGCSVGIYAQPQSTPSSTNKNG